MNDQQDSAQMPMFLEKGTPTPEHGEPAPAPRIEEGTPLPQPVNVKKGEKFYALYFYGHREEDIAGWFEEAYGYPPDEIIKTGGGILAGPKKETRSIMDDYLGRPRNADT